MTELQDLFEIIYGVNLEYDKMKEVRNGIPFVSRKSEDNGVAGYVKKIENVLPNPASTISLAASGSVMECFFQEKEYYSGRDLYYLKPRIPLTKNQMLYYCMILRHNKYRYSYGRQANKTVGFILVPSVEEIPEYINDIEVIKPSDKSVNSKAMDLSDVQWNYFSLDCIFKVTGTKSYIKEHIREYGTGQYPYVVTSSENNGVQGFYNHFTEEGNVLTIDSATVGSCFYQATNFSASDHVEKLIPKFKMNTYIALFIKTIMRFEEFRYGYGRKFAQERIKRTKIKLPAKSKDEPDWQFMEDYIKSLSSSSNL